MEELEALKISLETETDQAYELEQQKLQSELD